MAVLAVAAAGAAIGNVLIPAGFLGISGAGIGWTAGALLGNYLFGPKPDDVYQEGPRLQDLAVQGGSYGAPLPKTWGTVRLSGTIIWQRDLNESIVVTEEDVGGKGGGGSTVQTTTYYYAADFAVALCEGPASVRRIWADGKLIWSRYAEESATGDYTDYITFHPGTATQDPDSDMESLLGAGNVPAHRHACYAVFYQLPLERFGNRIPQLSFEVTSYEAGGTPYEFEGITLPTSHATGARYGFWVDITPDGTKMVVGEDLRGPGRVYIYKRWPGRWLLTHEWNNGSVFSDQFGNAVALSADGKQLAVGAPKYNDTITGQGGVYLYDYDSATDTWTQRGDVLVAGDPGYNRHFGTGLDLSDDGTVLVVGASGWWGGITRQGCVYVFDRDGDGWTQRGSVVTASDAGYEDLYGASVALSKTKETMAVGALDWDGTNANQGAVYLYDWNGSSWVERGDLLLSPEPAVGQAFGTCCEFAQDNAMLLVSAYGYTGDAGASQGAVWPVCDVDGEWVVGERVTPSDADAGDEFGNGVTCNEDGTMLVVGAGGWDDVRTDQGVVYTYTAAGSACNACNPDWDASIAGARLSDIVAHICRECGLSHDQYDVSLLTECVAGYVRTNRMSGRAAIEPLQRAFFFDAAEIDGRLTFIPRASATATGITLDEDAIGAYQGGEPASELTVTRAQQVEIPREVRVSYADYDRDHQVGIVAVQNQAATQEHALDVQFPIVFDSSEAKNIAAKHLFTSYQDRVRVSTTVGAQHMRLTPMDRLTIDDGATSYDVRLDTVRMDGLGLIHIEGSVEDADSYTSDAMTDIDDDAVAGDSALFDFFTPQVEAPTTPEMVAQYLDIPILQDADDDAGWYAAAYGEGDDAWPGGSLFRSINDTDYSAQVSWSRTNEARVGTISAAAGSVTHPWVWDDANSITVDMAAPDMLLYSATDADVLAGSNHVAVGVHGRWEIIGFGTATPQLDGSWVLTHLLRGRRGTEHNIGTGQADDTLVFLDTAGLRRPNMDINSIGLERYYRPVSFGLRLGDVVPATFTNSAVGLKPFAPVDLAGVRDSVTETLTITWKRRTRIGGEWADSVDVPLGEDSEAYEVDLYEGSTFLRTVEATSETCDYTLAEYNSDTSGSASAIPTLAVDVYQLSEIVGRGYPGEANL